MEVLPNILSVHSGIWQVPCQVVKVLEAGIIRVDADLGWGISKKNLDVIIDKYWYPDQSTPEGKKAFEWAKAELPVGISLTLHSRWMLELSKVVGMLYFPDATTYVDRCVAAEHGYYR